MGIEVTPPFVAAGEDIRWVPRRRVSTVALPGNDFWLFDDEVVVFLIFAAGGLVVDRHRTTDRGAIELCRASFEEVWKLSIPTMSTSRSNPAKHAREALGVRLREIRKEAGLTGRALAPASGVTTQRSAALKMAARRSPRRTSRRGARSAAPKARSLI